MKKRILGLLMVLVLLVVLVPTSMALAFPQPGHHIYGSIALANHGDVLIAEVNGRITSTIINGQNNYGYEWPLVIPAGDGSRIGGKTGEVIYFYLNGELIGQCDFEVWGVTKLDFVK